MFSYLFLDILWPSEHVMRAGTTPDSELKCVVINKAPQSILFVVMINVWSSPVSFTVSLWSGCQYSPFHIVPLFSQHSLIFFSLFLSLSHLSFQRCDCDMRLSFFVSLFNILIFFPLSSDWDPCWRGACALLPGWWQCWSAGDGEEGEDELCTGSECSLFPHGRQGKHAEVLIQPSNGTQLGNNTDNPGFY